MRLLVATIANVSVRGELTGYHSRSRAPVPTHSRLGLRLPLRPPLHPHPHTHTPTPTPTLAKQPPTDCCTQYLFKAGCATEKIIGSGQPLPASRSCARSPTRPRQRSRSRCGVASTVTVRGLSFACLLSTPTSLLTHKQPTQLLSYTYIYSLTPPHTHTHTHPHPHTHLHSPASTQPIAARSISLRLDVQKQRQLWRQGSLCPLARPIARSLARSRARAPANLLA